MGGLTTWVSEQSKAQPGKQKHWQEGVQIVPVPGSKDYSSVVPKPRVEEDERNPVCSNEEQDSGWDRQDDGGVAAEEASGLAEQVQPQEV